MKNLLKEWKDYVNYEKTTIDLLNRCTVNTHIKDNGDIVIKFLRDVCQYDEFFPEQNEYLELEKQKFKKALSERTLEFIRTDENGMPHTLLSIPCKDLEEGQVEPFIRNRKVIGLVLKHCEDGAINYSKLEDALFYGDTIECSLKDIGKASQIRGFEGCLDNLEKCNTPASIRVLRWLMEYGSNCGRALDKDCWEKINDFKNTDLNQEQQEAVELILNTTDIGFIMGPPGTGKTSVIAEAIYQLAKRGKKILLSSQSNDAIDNALDRLKAHPDIRAVRLVSRDDYPDKTFDRSFFAWNMVSSLDEDIKRAVGKVDDFLKKCVEFPRTPSQEMIFKKYIYDLVTSHYVADLSTFKNKLKEDYPWSENEPFHAFLAKFINIILGRPENKFIRFEEYVTKLRLIACKLQNIPELEADWILKGSKTISAWKDNHFATGSDEKALQRQKEIRQSFTKIREALNTANFDADSDAETLQKAYNKDFYAKLVRTSNVFGITCNANNEKLTSELMQRSVEYDYVIIDEVSKATTLELLAPMLKAPKCILIGDHHQLPPVFLADDDLKGNEELCYKYEDLITNTFFKNYFDVAPEAAKCVLRKQYRMHSEISNIAVANFYKASANRPILENGLTQKQEDNLKAHGITIQNSEGRNLVVPEHHIYWIDSTPYTANGELSDDRSLYEDRKETTSCANEYEIKGILKLLQKLETAQAAKENPKKLKVGVISFYSLQNKLLKKAVSSLREKLKHLDVDVNTVDRFQGQEREIIIVSLVRSKKGKINSGNEFFRKYERINVAFSRAQKLLFIVGSERFCEVQSVSIDYISLTGKLAESELLFGEELVYKNIINKLKQQDAFFNIKDLNLEE